MAAAAFPAFHVTGAIHHYVQTPLASSPIYLGTCESTPQVVFQETSKPVFNDIGGGQIPMQQVEQGEMAVLASAINRFSKSTYQTLLQQTQQLGRRAAFSRGRLRFGRTTFKLWMVYENALDAIVRAEFPGLEMGWYFPTVQIENRSFERMGTADELWVMNATAFPLYTPFSGNAGALAGGTWLLYSKDDADFPDDVKVPQ